MMGTHDFLAAGRPYVRMSEKIEIDCIQADDRVSDTGRYRA
jgi:hypothetical protein